MEKSTKTNNSISRDSSMVEDDFFGSSKIRPSDFATVKEGDIVLEFGTGVSSESFFLSHKVGKSGKVIRIDTSPERITFARKYAEKYNISNVEVRLSEFERLPLGDSSVNYILGSGVVNHSNNRSEVLKESLRVLGHGGQLSISDIALKRKLPKKVRTTFDGIAGAALEMISIDEYTNILEEVGFKDVCITIEGASIKDVPNIDDKLAGKMMAAFENGDDFDNYFINIHVKATKCT